MLEQQATNVGTGIMGGDHTYIVPGADQPERQKGSAAAMRRYAPPPPSPFPLILLLFAIEKQDMVQGMYSKASLLRHNGLQHA